MTNDETAATPDSAPPPSEAHSEAHSASDSTTPMRKGVVVVHGAGSERQSGAILELGAPLIDWMRRWVEAHDYTLRVNQAALRFGTTDDNLSDDPPHLHITLGSVDDDSDLVRPIGASAEPREAPSASFDWVMTEAWWAWSSVAPPLLDITFWLLTHFMRVVLAFWSAWGHRVGKVWKNLWSRDQRMPQVTALWLDLLLTVLALLLSVVALLPAIVGILLAVLLSQVPIQAVRDFALVSPVATFLTLMGGQMYTLANDETQAANFRGRLERAIRWLQNQGCEEIYIMAHSAGCVVSYETLCAQGDIWNPALSGLVTPPKDTPNVVALFTMGEAINLDRRLLPAKWWRHPHQWRLYVPLKAGIRWVDFYAGQDLVPAGPVRVPKHVRPATQQFHTASVRGDIAAQAGDTGMLPHPEDPVTNWMDILSDHWGYWKNDEHVLSRIACEIDAGRDRDWNSPGRFYDERYVSEGQAARLTRVGALAAIRMGFYALFVAAAVQPETGVLGQALLRLLAALPVIGGVVTWLNGGAVHMANPTVAGWVCALLTLGIGYFLLYNVLASGLWDQWDVQARIERMRKVAHPRAKPRWGYNGWLCGAVAIPVAATVAGGWLLGAGFVQDIALAALVVGAPLPLVEHLRVEGEEDARRDVVRALDRVRAVHQHLRLDDRHDAGLLAERCIARERMRVRPDAVLARQLVGDRVRRAPLRETGTELVVLLEASAEPVEALGDRLALRERQRLRAEVDLDPGDDALRGEQLWERRSVERALADRLVEEDDAADVFLGTGRREEQIAVGAPVLLGRLEPDRVEALLDRAGALVSGEDALPLGDERLRGLVQLGVHRVLPLVFGGRG